MRVRRGDRPGDREPDVRLLERGRVVHAVAGHPGDEALVFEARDAGTCLGRGLGDPLAAPASPTPRRACGASARRDDVRAEAELGGDRPGA